MLMAVMDIRNRLAFGTAFRRTIPTIERTNTANPVTRADIPIQSGMELPPAARMPMVNAIHTILGPRTESPNLRPGLDGSL